MIVIDRKEAFKIKKNKIKFLSILIVFLCIDVAFSAGIQLEINENTKLIKEEKVELNSKNKIIKTKQLSRLINHIDREKNHSKINNWVSINTANKLLNKINKLDVLIGSQIDSIKSRYLLEPEYISGELIIKFNDEVQINMVKQKEKYVTTNIKSINFLNEKYSASKIEKITNQYNNIFKLTLNEETDMENAVIEYAKNPYIIYAEPNYIYYSNNIPNDDLFEKQWSLNNLGQDGGNVDADIDAPEAWDIITGGSNITIAILDSGIDYKHPDIISNIWINSKEDINGNQKFDNWPKWMKKNGITGDIDHIDNDANGFKDDILGWDFFRSNNNPTDNYGHGTHCAGIAAAMTNNQLGISGISWKSKIMGLKIGFEKGMLLSAALGAIDYCMKNNADIISMSWGGPGLSHSLKDMLDEANKNGIILVAGAGNAPVDIGITPFYPACYKNTIAVAAHDNNGNLASFSSYGLPVDLCAPGINIVSLRAENSNMMDDKFIVDEKYVIASGTSMACPHVAGVAALLLSKNPELTPLEIKTILKSSTDKIHSDKYAGTGRLNAYTSLQKIKPVTSIINQSSKIEIKNSSFSINGSAYGQGFKNYVIEYNKGLLPESWIEYHNSTVEKINDNLAEINISNLDDGLYSIRLKTLCDQMVYSDISLFLIDNKQETLYVDDNGGKKFKSITNALNNAGEKDTVFVFNGKYNESLFIYRSLNLIGENNEKTILNSTYTSIHLQNVNNMTVKNFKIFTPNTGIFANIVENITISSIHLENSKSIDIENIMEESVIGFHINFAEHITLLNNVINNNHTIGILITGLNGSYILQNTIDKNLIGYYSLMSTENNIFNNNITNNYFGYIFYRAELNNISNNIINQNFVGIMFLSKCVLNVLKHNVLTYNSLLGLSLRRGSNSNQIINNCFEKNGISATFTRCIINKWDNNYWDRPKYFPKIIFGKIGRLRIPWMNFDLNPARDSYDFQV